MSRPGFLFIVLVFIISSCKNNSLSFTVGPHSQGPSPPQFIGGEDKVTYFLEEEQKLSDIEPYDFLPLTSQADTEREWSFPSPLSSKLIPPDFLMEFGPSNWKESTGSTQGKPVPLLTRQIGPQELPFSHPSKEHYFIQDQAVLYGIAALLAPENEELILVSQSEDLLAVGGGGRKKNPADHGPRDFSSDEPLSFTIKSLELSTSHPADVQEDFIPQPEMELLMTQKGISSEPPNMSTVALRKKDWDKGDYLLTGKKWEKTPSSFASKEQKPEWEMIPLISSAIYMQESEEELSPPGGKKTPSLQDDVEQGPGEDLRDKELLFPVFAGPGGKKQKDLEAYLSIPVTALSFEKESPPLMTVQIPSPADLKKAKEETTPQTYAFNTLRPPMKDNMSHRDFTLPPSDVFPPAGEGIKNPPHSEVQVSSEKEYHISASPSHFVEFSSPPEMRNYPEFSQKNILENRELEPPLKKRGPPQPPLWRKMAFEKIENPAGIVLSQGILENMKEEDADPPAVDILFVIDTSSSMSTNLIDFFTKFQNFLSILRGLDLRIGFTDAEWEGPYPKGSLFPLEDNGNLLADTVLTPRTESFESVFLHTISKHNHFQYTKVIRNRTVSVHQCELPPFCQGRREEPLRVLFGMFSQDGGHFFRDNSHIVAVVITNYEESESGGRPITKPLDVVEAFNKHFGSDRRMSVFGAHVQSHDSACLEENDQVKWMFNEAGFSKNLETLIEMTGGSSTSICSSLYDQMAKDIYFAVTGKESLFPDNVFVKGHSDK